MERLVTLTTVRVEPEAQILKACLEANGIRCMMTGNSAASVAGANNMITTSWENPLGGISIRVRESDLDAAQEILRSTETSESSGFKEPAPWNSILDRGLRNVPLPLRVMLIVFGSLYLAGSLGLLLAGLYQKLSWFLS